MGAGAEVTVLQSASEDGECERDGVSFIDLSTLRAEFTPNQFHASRFDPHPSALVHKTIGEKLAEYILEKYLLENRP